MGNKKDEPLGPCIHLMPLCVHCRMHLPSIYLMHVGDASAASVALSRCGEELGAGFFENITFFVPNRSL
ncbi:hypothetical protein Bca4012_018567 [Brassica carinata]